MLVLHWIYMLVFFLLFDDCHWTSNYINFQNLWDFNGSLMYGFAHPYHWFSCFHLWSVDGLAMGPPVLFLLFDDCHWTSKFINFHNLCDFNGSLMYGFAHPYHWFSCFHLWSVDGLAMGPPVLFLLFDDCHWTSKFINFHNLCDFNGSLMYGLGHDWLYEWLSDWLADWLTGLTGWLWESGLLLCAWLLCFSMCFAWCN